MGRGGGRRHRERQLSILREHNEHTNLIQLNREILGAHSTEQVLGGTTVWTIAFAEDGYRYIIVSYY